MIKLNIYILDTVYSLWMRYISGTLCPKLEADLAFLCY